jgi:branched-chain amino acid transport system substrate-binding protein
MKRSLSVACALFFATVVAGCGKGEKAATGPNSGSGSTDPIVIGSVLELSGEMATFGEETKAGLDLALEKVNKDRARPIEVKYSDNKGAPTDSANAVVQLVSRDNVMAIIGAVASSNTMAGARKAQESQTPMITPGSTNVDVTKIGDYVSRVCFVDDVQGPLIAQFAAEELGKKKGYLVIERSSAYSVGLKDAIAKRFEELGGTIVGESFFESKTPDFSALISEVKAAQPDVIFIPAYYGDVGTMLKQAQDHWDGIAKVGGDGWDSPELQALGGGGVIGTYFTTHFAVDDDVPEVQEFVELYKQKYDGALPGSMCALGYDAGLALAAAIDSIDGELTKEKLKDAINATKDLKGATGTITLDANRNPIKVLVAVEVTPDGFRLKKKYPAE